VSRWVVTRMESGDTNVGEDAGGSVGRRVTIGGMGSRRHRLLSVSTVVATALTGAVLVSVVSPVDAATRRTRRVTTTRPRVTVAPTTAPPATTVPPTTVPPTTAAPTTTVPANPFSLSRPIIPISVGRGGSVTIREIVTYNPGFSGELTWAMGAARDGVSVTVSPNPSRNTAEITVRAAADAVLGPNPIAGTVSGGGVTRDLTVLAIVGESTSGTTSNTILTAAQQWNVTVDPVGQLAAGFTANVTIRITRGNGFTGALAVAPAIVPTGITLGVSQNPITGDTATLVVTAAAGLASGNYQAIIQFSNGTVVSFAVIGIVVP
jgi:hypothetical protein